MTRADVLLAGVRAAIRHNCPRSQISVPRWAETYGVTQKQVRETWENELTKITNSASMGEGK